MFSVTQCFTVMLVMMSAIFALSFKPILPPLSSPKNLMVWASLPSTEEGQETTPSPFSISESLSSNILKKDLLSLIPSCPFGAPATNVTLEQDTVDQIQQTASNLEFLTPLPPLAQSFEAVQTLDGDWRLIYSDASEITRLIKLPLGFSLGPVYQCIDVRDGRFENQALVKHFLRIVSGHTRVRADFWVPSPDGKTNRAGVPNTRGDRVNVKFQQVIFTLRRFLILPTFGRVRKTAAANGPAEQAGVVPCIDVTYLDNDLRLSRGGDGSLFVLLRADGQQGRGTAMRMLPKHKSIVVDDKNNYDASKDILPTRRNNNNTPDK